MLIRAARAEEMTRIGDLRVDTYVQQGLLKPDSFYAPSLHRLGSSGKETVLVAVDGAEILGTAAFQPYTADSETAVSPDEGEVRAVAVTPEAHGRGIGRELVRAVIATAADRGLDRLVLSTQPAMVTAQRMYASEGFLRLPERDWSPLPGLTLMVYGLGLGPPGLR